MMAKAKKTRINKTNKHRFSYRSQYLDRKGKGKGTVQLLMEVLHDTAIKCDLTYGITPCYLSPHTSSGTQFTYPGGMEG